MAEAAPPRKDRLQGKFGGRHSTRPKCWPTILTQDTCNSDSNWIGILHIVGDWMIHWMKLQFQLKYDGNKQCRVNHTFASRYYTLYLSCLCRKNKLTIQSTTWYYCCSCRRRVSQMVFQQHTSSTNTNKLNWHNNIPRVTIDLGSDELIWRWLTSNFEYEQRLNLHRFYPRHLNFILANPHTVRCLSA